MPYIIHNGVLYHADNELYHFGVKGMKWGVRKTQRTARKDAKEFARAKMYYGEGAGTRRKLIKAKVEERSRDDVYKKAFDDALSKQDMAKHATKAKQERAVKTAAKNTVKTGRGIINAAMGNIGRASASAAALYTLAHVTGADKVIARYAKQTITQIAQRLKR